MNLGPGDSLPNENDPRELRVVSWNGPQCGGKVVLNSGSGASDVTISLRWMSFARYLPTPKSYPKGRNGRRASGDKSVTEMGLRECFLITGLNYVNYKVSYEKE